VFFLNGIDLVYCDDDPLAETAGKVRYDEKRYTTEGFEHLVEVNHIRVACSLVITEISEP
jgi:hypothetical protein